MHRGIIATALLPCLALLGPAASSADDTAGTWAVTGVAADDVLHLRDVPSADSESLARIPPNARGLKNLGCLRGELALDRWMSMTKEERRLARTGWCRVEYEGRQGWVAARFITKEQ